MAACSPFLPIKISILSPSRAPGARQLPAGLPLRRGALGTLLTVETSPRYQEKRGGPYQGPALFLCPLIADPMSVTRTYPCLMGT